MIRMAETAIFASALWYSRSLALVDRSLCGGNHHASD